jgi:hypothetical protein
MQETKDYWKLGKDQFGDTLWMQKPRKAPNGYWETCMVFHYPKGTRPGKGEHRICACMTDYVMNATAFDGIIPEDIRYKFLELMRAIVIASRYAWMLRRGNTGMTEVDGERKALSIHTAVHGCNEILRINVGVIPELVKLVDNLFNGGKQ